MWIYHPFKPGAVPHRCFHDLGGVFCDRPVDHPTHQDAQSIMWLLGVTDVADVLPALRKRLATAPAEARTGISDRAAAALNDVTNLRRLTRGLASMGLPDLSAELDRIEQALHGDGGA